MTTALDAKATKLGVVKGVNKEYLTAHQQKLDIVFGDILEETTEIIVQDTNPQCNFAKSPLDKKLGAKTSAEVEQECKAYVQKNGSLQPGKATLIKLVSASSLKCKAIAFTSKPQWLGGKKGEEVKLRDCVYNTLELANKAVPSFTSIAFPAIGAGMGGFPKDKCAQVMWKTAMDWISAKKDGTAIKTIRFTSSDPEVIAKFMEQYKQTVAAPSKEPADQAKAKTGVAAPAAKKAKSDDLLDDLDGEFEIKLSAKKKQPASEKSSGEQEAERLKRQQRRGEKRKPRPDASAVSELLENSPKRRNTTSTGGVEMSLDADSMAISTTLQADEPAPAVPFGTTRNQAAMPNIDMSLAEEDLWKK